MHKHTPSQFSDSRFVCLCVRVCFSDALSTGCNWLREADRLCCSLARYQTDGQTGKDSRITLRNASDLRGRKHTYTQKHLKWTNSRHTHTWTHASAVTLTDCDKGESVPNVLTLDDSQIGYG